MFGYGLAIKVLQEHIRKQDKVIEGLLSELRGKEVTITKGPEPVRAVNEEEEEEERYVPMFDNRPSPGSIINEDN